MALYDSSATGAQHQFQRTRARSRAELITRLNKLDYPALFNMLINPHVESESQLLAVIQFSTLSADERSRYMRSALQTMLTSPASYNEEVLLAIIELLATDPDPIATRALLAGIPLVAKAALSDDNRLSEDFRVYYYAATLTRRRSDDETAWHEALPTYDGDTLLSLQLDPAAEQMRAAVRIMKLIDRLPGAERQRTLRALALHADARQGWQAVRMMFGGRSD